MDSHVVSLFVILMSILWTNSHASVCQETVDYIDGKLRSTKVSIAKAYLQDSESVTTMTYDIKKKVLWSRKLNSLALTVGLSNEMFVLVESNRVMSIGVDTNFPNSSPLGLHEVSILRPERPVKFIKSIIWNKVIYLLICHDMDYCNIYTNAGDSSLQFQQAMRYAGRPVDANFFTENGQLYLVVATNLETFPSLSVIYRWTGTYMDIIAEISLNSVVSVVTFSHKGSLILVFGQDNALTPNIGSQIYKLTIDETSGFARADIIQFLSTTRPVAMHLYVHDGCTFLLVLNEVGPSQVFWWEGKEFLPWIAVEGIRGYNLLHSVHVDGDTFLFAAQVKFIVVYRVSSVFYEPVQIFELQDAIIIDLGVWSDGKTILAVVITERGPSLYTVEPWQLFVHKVKKDEAAVERKQDALKITLACFEKLQEALANRMESVRRSAVVWDRLYSASDDALIDTLEADVILRSSEGSVVIKNLEIVSNSEEEIRFPAEIRNLTENLENRINESVDRSQNLVTNDEKTKVLSFSSLVVTDRAKFKQLVTPSLQTNYFNDENPVEKLQSAVSLNGDQIFTEPLLGRNVTIHNLELEQICGIPKEFWLLKNESTRIPMKSTGSIKIANGTVIMKSNVFVSNLQTTLLNSRNISEFIESLFVIGEDQVINGDVVFNSLSTDNLTLNELNGIPAENFLTITTEQSIKHPVFADSLVVRHLTVNSIGGIRPADAARTNRENVILGKVKMEHLTITNELIVDENCDMLRGNRKTQVYVDVTIDGNVTVSKLNLYGSIELPNRGIFDGHVEKLFATSWTKSGDQTVTAPVFTFERGITIDELHAEYLNDIRKDHYLYTTAEAIPADFRSIHFEHFVVNGAIRRENQLRDAIEFTDDAVKFNERIHFQNLAAVRLFTDHYNGIPVSAIMNSTGNSNELIPIFFPDDVKFEKMIVNNLQVGDLHFGTLNDANFSDILFADQDYQVDSVEAEELTATDFRPAAANSLETAQEFLTAEATGEVNLFIDGPLIVDENLHIEESISGQSVEMYLDYISTADIRINEPDLVLDELTVLGDATIDTLNGVNFDNFVENIFSKTRDQTLVGTKIFHRVSVENLWANRVNEKAIGDMQLVNDSLVFDGDISFTHLSADVKTPTVNDMTSDWLHADVSPVPFTSITELRSTGDISWKNSNASGILSDLLNNAVTTDGDQIVEAPVNFAAIDEVEISSLKTADPSITWILDTVGDAALPNNSIVEISGKKRFLQDAEFEELIVDDLNVDQLDTMSIRELNASIIRKFDDVKRISGTCVFTGDTEIFHLNVSDLGPGMPDISSFFVLSDSEDNYLPDGTYISHLVIKEEAIVRSLDGVDVGEFLSERVTTTGDHVIQSDVRFNGHIQVLGDIEVEDAVNDIVPSDLVLNDTAEPQIIDGQKTFANDLVVKADVEAPLFNDIDIRRAYANSIRNDESVVIQGNLIFGEQVELLQEMKIVGTVNDIKLDAFLQDWEHNKNRHLERIDRNMTQIEAVIDQEEKNALTKPVPEIFLYFETEKYLSFSNIRNVNKIKTVVNGEATKLNAYGVLYGENCPGLPVDCFCRSQCVLEVSEKECKSQQQNSSWIVYNFQEPNGQFVINVATNTISTCSACRRYPAIDEYTAISWVVSSVSGELGDFMHYSQKISGYLSDAQVFVHGRAVYIVLTAFYDVLQDTHLVNSSIFKLDLMNNEISLDLSVCVASASAVEVFSAASGASYVLIASGVPEKPTESARSLLYRIKPGGRQFELLRCFYTGGTRKIKSLGYHNDDFLFLDDVLTNAVHIYNYKENFDNFYLYQTLDFDAKISAIEIFYAGRYRQSDAYVLITTEDHRFFLYEYMLYGKFQEKMRKWIDGLIAVTPFQLSQAQYALVTTRDNSTVYRMVQQGPH